jgi:hypothetical protein
VNRKAWFLLAGALFVAAALVIVVALGGGENHPRGEIEVAAATPPGVTMRLESVGSCHDDFPGWSALGTPSGDTDVKAWFDAEWGPVVEPWTSREAALGGLEQWTHYQDISVQFRVDGRFVVRTFDTLTHQCPRDIDQPWGDVPETAWSTTEGACPDTTNVYFARIAYDPKRDAFGGIVAPTNDAPIGWERIDYPNGGTISYLDGDASEIVVRLPGTSTFQKYGLLHCVPTT